MPRDADYGRELASKLRDVFTGRVTNVEFTYDSFIELDQLDASQPYCKISPTVYENFRESRSIWRETTQLSLTLVSAVGPTDNDKWIDDWLDSWDMLIRQLREMQLFDSRHKPTSIDTDSRYDPDLFHNHRRLVTQAAIHYSNVEVI